MSDPFRILVVEDEPDVRATFRDWLQAGVPNLELIEASNAVEALDWASRHPIDLAVLDWNLGAGIDGLQVLKSLTLFQPQIVAILVTGHANLATPLQALKLGVRDYLDKHAGLDKATFLQSVHRQLDYIAPIKREKAVRASLEHFRDTLVQSLPVLQQARALRPETADDPFMNLAQILVHALPCTDAALITFDSRGQATVRRPLEPETATSRHENAHSSLAWQVLSSGNPLVIDDASGLASDPTIRPLPVELDRGPVLILPLGTRNALELFAPAREHFGPSTELVLRLTGPIGRTLDLARSGTSDVVHELATAVNAALDQTRGLAPSPNESGIPNQLLEHVRKDLESSWREVLPAGSGEAGLRAARALADLASRHGIAALNHVEQLIQATSKLLDATSGENG
jgi:CheY-like chemotaxis protein